MALMNAVPVGFNLATLLSADSVATFLEQLRLSRVLSHLRLSIENRKHRMPSVDCWHPLHLDPFDEIRRDYTYHAARYCGCSPCRGQRDTLGASV